MSRGGRCLQWALRLFLVAGFVLAFLPERAAAAPCGSAALGQIGVRKVFGFVVMPGKIGDTPVSFLLDSGAEAGLITADAVKTLHLPVAHNQKTLLRGTGGATLHDIVQVPNLSVGSLGAAGMAFPVGRLPALPNIEPKVAGLLGADMLARFDVDFDLAHGKITLYPPGACVGARPWPDAAPLAATRSGPRLVVQAELDGHSVTGLLDTGAHAILLSLRKALALGVTTEALSRDAGGLTSGIDQRSVPFYWHHFVALTIGTDRMVAPVLTVTELRDASDMLIGSDWFLRHRVWLSWATQQIWIGR